MTEQEVNNLIDSKIGKVKMSQLPETDKTGGLYSIGYNGNQSVKYKANLLQGDPLTVRKTYQTEALALADKNPIDTTTSLPLKVGQFVSIVDDGEKNGIYRISSIGVDGTMALELQGKLGDLSEYTKTGGSTKTTKEVDDTVIKLEQNSLKLKPFGDALFNPYDSDGVGVDVAYRTAATSYSCPPIPFNDNDALVVIYCHGYALYDNEMVRLKRQNISFSSTPTRISKEEGAEFIRLSTPLDNRFDARATYPAGSGHSLKTTDAFKFEADSLVNGADVVFKTNDDFSNISNAFNGITEVIDATPLVNVEDRAISRFGGGHASVAGYVSSGYIDIEGVDKIEFFNTMNNAGGGYSPLLFYTGVTVGTFLSSYTPIFDTAMPFTMYRDSFKDAKRIRVSYLKSQEDEFYIKLTKGSGISYVDLSQRNISAPTLEWAQRNAPSSEVVQVGSFSVRKIAEPLAITDASTIVEGYEPINRDLRKPVGKVQVTGSYVNTSEMYHVGKYTKKIYCRGDVYGSIGVADSWKDFLDQNITTISIAPIRAGVHGIREMQNGELIVMGGNAPTGGIINPADGIYVSEGWAENYKTNTPVNFILKQQWQSVRNAPQDAWGFHCVGNKILISEYSTAGSVFENSYVYYSTDFGQTFTAIFDIETQFGNSNNRVPPRNYQHIHGCCIDPYWDRLWVFPGEGAVDGQCISYSDDEGATWTHLSTNTLQKTLEVANVSQWMKYCAAHALDTGVIMGTDSQPNGIWRYNRVKKNVESGSVAPYLEEAKRYDIGANHRTTITHIMGHLTRVVDSDNEYPIIVCSPMVGLYSNVNAINQSGLVHISYDGVRFYEIWRESNPDFKAPENFKDNDMKAYAYEDGSIYIVAKYFDGTSIRNRVIVGRLPETN